MWGTGDSEIPRYRPFADLMQRCQTVKDLERVVDITVFDWEAVGAGATIEEDNAAPRGIEHVFVGGEPILRDSLVL